MPSHRKLNPKKLHFLIKSHMTKCHYNTFGHFSISGVFLVAFFVLILALSIDFSSLREDKSIPDIDEKLPPVIFVNGFMGSRMLVDLPPEVCEKIDIQPENDSKHRTFDLWINIPIFFKGDSRCLVQELSPYCDSRDLNHLGLPRCRMPTPGVRVRPGPTGDNAAADDIHLFLRNPIRRREITVPYFRGLRSVLQRHGFGVIRSLNQNWVFAPSSWETDFERYTRLVDDIYAETGRPALLIAHSLGAVTTAAFLATQDPEWVQERVLGVVYITPAFSGVPTGLVELTLAMPGLGYVPSEYMRELNTRLPVMHALAPRTSVWPFDFDPLVVGDRTYDNETLDELLVDWYGQERAELHAAFRCGIDALAVERNPVPVPTTWVVGTALPSPAQFALTKKLRFEPSAKHDATQRIHTALARTSRVMRMEAGDGTLLAAPLRKAWDEMTKEAEERGIDTSLYSLVEATGNSRHQQYVSDVKTVEEVVWPVIRKMLANKGIYDD